MHIFVRAASPGSGRGNVTQALCKILGVCVIVEALHPPVKLLLLHRLLGGRRQIQGPREGGLHAGREYELHGKSSATGVDVKSKRRALGKVGTYAAGVKGGRPLLWNATNNRAIIIGITNSVNWSWMQTELLCSCHTHEWWK